MTARRECPEGWVGVSTGRTGPEVALTLGISPERLKWIVCHAPGVFISDDGAVYLPPLFKRETLSAWIKGSAATGDRQIAEVFAFLGFDVPIPHNEF